MRMAYVMMTSMSSGGNSSSSSDSNNSKQGISEAQQQHAEGGGGGGGGGDGGVGKKKSGGHNSEKTKRTTSKIFNKKSYYILLLLLFLSCCTIMINFTLHPELQGEQHQQQEQGTTKWLEDYSFEPPRLLLSTTGQQQQQQDRYKSKSKYTQESREQKQTILDNNNQEEEEEEKENDTTEDDDEDGGKEEEEEEEEEEIKLMYELWNHTTSTIDIPNKLRPPFSFVGGSPDTDTTTATATFKLTSLEILQSVLHGEENENEYLAVEEYIRTNYSLPTTKNTIPQCLIPNKIATRELANEFVLQNKKPSLPVLNVGMPKMGTTTLVSYIDTHIFRG
jgi:hypothetical protein